MAGEASERGQPSVVVVTGPTASGKSALGLRLAEAFRGEIVNADSMQVYRYMDIGTAKPSLADRARVPHHLIDVVTPDVRYNAGRYAREARAAASDVHARGRRLFLVGGTGLYIRAFLEGLPPDLGADPEIRHRLEEEHGRAAGQGDPQRLHRRLAAVDPAMARRLHPNDLRRIIRALEILEVSGRPASEVQKEALPPAVRYRVLHLALDPGREALARRIDARCEQMIAAGLLGEVRALRARGYGPELPSMQAIGYRHMQPVLDGLETLANVLVAMKRDTRQFARRQRTWLRRVRDAVWVHPDDERAIQARVERFLANGPAPERARDAEVGPGSR